MAAPKVDGTALKQALEEFGSLQEAVDTLKMQKRVLENKVSALTKDIHAKEKARAEYLNDINYLEKTIKEHTETLNRIMDNINRYANQYRLFESFVAMLLTSPSTEENLEDLVANILALSKIVWRTDWLPDKFRSLFVYTVLGEHLHCYCCDRCGLKFIANQEVQSHILGYHCPNCGFMSSMKADDSFLYAMLSSSEPSNANEAQEQDE